MDGKLIKVKREWTRWVEKDNIESSESSQLTLGRFWRIT
jgi:hypothetical protein